MKINLKARGQHDVLDSPDLKGRRTDTSSDDIWQQEKVMIMILRMILRMTMLVVIMMITMITMILEQIMIIIIMTSLHHDNKNGGDAYSLRC